MIRFAGYKRQMMLMAVVMPLTRQRVWSTYKQTSLHQRSASQSAWPMVTTSAAPSLNTMRAYVAPEKTKPAITAESLTFAPISLKVWVHSSSAAPSRWPGAAHRHRLTYHWRELSNKFNPKASTRTTPVITGLRPCLVLWTVGSFMWNLRFYLAWGPSWASRGPLMIKMSCAQFKPVMSYSYAIPTRCISIFRPEFKLPSFGSLAITHPSWVTKNTWMRLYVQIKARFLETSRKKNQLWWNQTLVKLKMTRQTTLS